MTFRWTDLGMRVETVNPVPLDEWSMCCVLRRRNDEPPGCASTSTANRSELKVLFDQLLWPIDTKKHPWRVGAGGGLRFKGSVDDVRVYVARSRPTKSAALTVLRLDRFAGAHRRRHSARLRSTTSCACAFSKRRASEGSAASGRQSRTAERGTQGSSSTRIPTVMVMEERRGRRDTFVLKRGAYDAPGEKVSAGRRRHS